VHPIMGPNMDPLSPTVPSADDFEPYCSTLYVRQDGPSSSTFDSLCVLLASFILPLCVLYQLCYSISLYCATEQIT